MSKAEIIEAYEAAYLRCNRREIKVNTHGGGWYSLGTSTYRKYRLAQLPEMTARLNARADEQEAKP